MDMFICLVHYFHIILHKDYSYSLLLQVRGKDKKILERYGHGAATLSVHSECMEIMLFGGKNSLYGSKLVNDVVLGFGRSYKNAMICLLLGGCNIFPVSFLYTEHDLFKLSRLGKSSSL